MIGKRYTAQYKIETVEEYLKEKEKDSNLKLAIFAAKKGIADSTFNDWVIKYKRQGQGFCNITTEIKKLNTYEIIDSEPKGMELIKEVKEENISMSKNRVRLKYNGVVIEFDKSLLERVMEIVRTW